MVLCSRVRGVVRASALAVICCSLIVLADREADSDQGPSEASSRRSSYRSARDSKGSSLPAATHLVQSFESTADQAAGIGLDAIQFAFPENYPMMFPMGNMDPMMEQAHRYPPNVVPHVVPNVATAQFTPLQSMIPQQMVPAGSALGFQPQPATPMAAAQQQQPEEQKPQREKSYLNSRVDTSREDIRNRVVAAAEDIDRLSILSQMREKREQVLANPHGALERLTDRADNVRKSDVESAHRLLKEGRLSTSRGMAAKLDELSDLERMALLHIMQQKFAEEDERERQIGRLGDKERQMGRLGILGGRKLEEESSSGTDTAERIESIQTPFQVSENQLLMLVAQAAEYANSLKDSEIPVADDVSAQEPLGVADVIEAGASIEGMASVASPTESTAPLSHSASSYSYQPPPRSRRFDLELERESRGGGKDFDWNRWDLNVRNRDGQSGSSSYTGTATSHLQGAAHYSPAADFAQEMHNQHSAQSSSLPAKEQCYEQRDFKTPDGRTVETNLPCDFAHLYDSDDPFAYSGATGMTSLRPMHYPEFEPMLPSQTKKERHPAKILEQIRSQERTGFTTRPLAAVDRRFSADESAETYTMDHDLESLASHAASFGIDPQAFKGLSVSGVPIEQLIANATPAEVQALIDNASEEQIEKFLSVHSFVPPSSAFDATLVADSIMGHSTSAVPVPLTHEQIQGLMDRQHLFTEYASAGAASRPMTGRHASAAASYPSALHASHGGSSAFGSMSNLPPTGHPFAGDFCQCPHDALDEFMDSLSLRQRLQLRSYLRELGYYEYGRDRLSRERFSRDGFSRDGRSRDGFSRDRDLFSFDRGQRRLIRRYGCDHGRLRREGRCSKVRAPLHKCDPSPTVYTSPTCVPQEVSNQICPDGFNLNRNKCTLNFDPLGSCPDGTTLTGGKCAVSGLQPSSQVVAEPHHYSRARMQSSLSSASARLPAAPLALGVNAVTSTTVGFSQSSAAAMPELCPSATVHYVDQCVPATGRRGSTGRRKLSRSVVAVCPTGFVPVDELGLSSASSAAMMGPDFSSQDMMCGRIVPADLSCPEGFEMVEKRKAGRGGGGVAETELVCQRNLRNQPVSSQCGPGLTLSPDGMTCVGKKRIAFSKMCEKGRLDGDRCTDYVSEAVAFDCPPGYQLEQHGMEAVCVEMSFGRGRNLHEGPSAHRHVRPKSSCRSRSAERVSRDTCVQPVFSEPQSYCPGGLKNVERNECFESVSVVPTLLCRDKDGRGLTENCVERQMRPTRKSCPASTVAVCADGAFPCDGVATSCFQTSGAAVARSNASGRPLNLSQAQRIGRHLLQTTGASQHLMEFCPVGSSLVMDHAGQEFCQIVTSPAVPRGCTKPEESCPGGHGVSLCPDGYSFAADRRLCAEDPQNSAAPAA